ncbi:hypothetical protein F66182_12733, partial [Fusarium sp. NRRL 66182]
MTHSNQTSNVALSSLPVEIQLSIIDYLDYTARIALAYTNRYFNEIVFTPLQINKARVNGLEDTLKTAVVSVFGVESRSISTYPVTSLPSANQVLQILTTPVSPSVGA